ncbi:hypothetical protein Syun_015522 [Stephania yunnanensis]|uniref:Cytochrome P450 n=1 Tax=Stephania yunnanensis TaxID=152371 RepID=A0AAP0P9T0_9MAGN
MRIFVSISITQLNKGKVQDNTFKLPDSSFFKLARSSTFSIAIESTPFIHPTPNTLSQRDRLSKPKIKASNKPPQANGAWPIIGHLHKLSGTGLPHMTLGAMADQYGSAFTIQLGTKQALVVSSWKVAKECFTTNDRALASRPTHTTMALSRLPPIVSTGVKYTLLLGASDTTMVTLTWTLSLFLNNPHVFKKAQEELMAQVGNDQHVDESDIKNLVYLQAIIKETIRLYPPAPLSAPREAIEDGVVVGYHVPVGMRVIANLWKIQRDPSIWDDPLEFQPERFLTTYKGIDVWGQHYELIPFGYGRRSCPGIALALQVVQLILAQLLHGFELIRPSGAPVDMTESVGLTNVKVTLVEVLLAPRFPPQLYEA